MDKYKSSRASRQLIKTSPKLADKFTDLEMELIRSFLKVYSRIPNNFGTKKIYMKYF